MLSSHQVNSHLFSSHIFIEIYFLLFLFILNAPFLFHERKKCMSQKQLNDTVIHPENLRPFSMIYKNLRSDKFSHSVVYGNIYVSPWYYSWGLNTWTGITKLNSQISWECFFIIIVITKTIKTKILQSPDAIVHFQYLW